MLAAVVFLIGTALAKDPCKMFDMTTDPLNGQVGGFGHYFDPGRFTGLDVQVKNGSWFMHLLTVKGGVVDQRGQPGDLARIVVGDQIVDLPAATETIPTTNANTVNIYTQWRVEYTLTPQQIETLASAPISIISMKIGETEYRMPLDKKDIAKLQQGFTCALSYTK